MLRLLTPLLIVMLAAACGVDVSTVTVTTGTPECVDGTQVKVRFQGCLSSSCDRLVSATCSLAVEGDTAAVTGAAIIERQSGECTDDCGLIEAVCTGELGSAVEVKFGDDLKDLGELTACP